MITFLRYGPLTVGTLLLISASLGCSFWFFYSFLYSAEAEQRLLSIFGLELPLLPMVAGLVGCGAQLFVYSFAANLVLLKGFVFKSLLILISTLTIGLSMFSTYSTLVSFLEQKSQEVQATTFIAEQRRALIASRNADIGISSQSAERAVGDNYRTQGSGIVAANEELRKRQLEELSQLQEVSGIGATASPLDGLVRVVGDSRSVSALFCAWLAITFDLLPILGISLIGRTAQRKPEPPEQGQSVVASNTSEVTPSSATSAPGDNSEALELERRAGEARLSDGTTTESPELEIEAAPAPMLMAEGRHPKASCSLDENTYDQEPANRMFKQIVDKAPIYSELPEAYQGTDVAEIPTAVIYPVISRFLFDGSIPMSYAGVMSFTGLSKWKVQQYFAKAVESGFLVNKTPENERAGYRFSKTVRYHLRRGVEVASVEEDCVRW
jgi:hypothetical protein